MPPVAASLPVLLDALGTYDAFECPGCGRVHATPAAFLAWPLAGPTAKVMLCDDCDAGRKDPAFRAGLGFRLLSATGH